MAETVDQKQKKDENFEFHQKRQRVTECCDKILAFFEEIVRSDDIALSEEQCNNVESWSSVVSKKAERLETNTFQIAFVGQMKAGKSTMVNASVFGDEILPVASTPQTAKLTVVKHGESPKARVKFYSPIEWQQFEEFAAEEKQAENTDFSYTELVDEAPQQIGDEFPSLLGNDREVSIDELSNYVAAYDSTEPQGRYVSVTKEVEVQYPTGWPEDVEVVDTPGTNDPNQLREQVTLDYLKKADAVVLVLYAGRTGDREDLSFLKTQLLPIGLNKIVVALNKFDMVPPEEADDVQGYLRNLLFDEVDNNDSLDIPEEFKQVLDIDRIYPVSGIRALLGRTEGEIKDGRFHFKKTCRKKGITTYSEALEKSGIEEFERGLFEFLMETKGNTMLQSPLRKGQAALRSIDGELEEMAERCHQQIGDLDKNREELEKEYAEEQEKLEGLTTAFEDIEEKFRRITRNELSDAIRRTRGRVKRFADETRRRANATIDDLGRLEAATSRNHVIEINTDIGWQARTLQSQIQTELQDALTRLKKKLRGDLLDEMRDRLPDYQNSPWLQGRIDEIGRVEPDIALPNFSEVNDFTGFIEGAKAIILLSDYKAKLKRRAQRKIQSFADSCLDYLSGLTDEVESEVWRYVREIVESVESHYAGRISDIEEQLTANEAKKEETEERRNKLRDRFNSLKQYREKCRQQLETTKQLRESIEIVG